MRMLLFALALHPLLIWLDRYVADIKCGYWTQGNSVVAYAVVLSSHHMDEREIIIVLDLIRNSTFGNPNFSIAGYSNGLFQLVTNLGQV